MTDGKQLVENLLAYGQDNLHLAAEDGPFLRALLYRRLGLVFDDAEEFPKPEKNLTLSSVYKETLTFVIENGLTEKFGAETKFEADDAYTVASIFGLVTPLSSYLNRTFKTFREKLSSEKACEFFYETLVNNAYVPYREYAKEELKDKQDKREFSFHTEIYSVSAPSGVPASTTRKGDNYRFLTFNFGGRDWKFSYVSDADYLRQGVLSQKEKTFAFNSEILEDVLDFCEYVPAYFCATRLYTENGAYVSEGFSTGEYLPVFAAKTQSVLTSDKYPDVEADILDYPQSVLRLSSFNRNTLLNLAEEVIIAYKNYEPQAKEEENGESAERSEETETIEKETVAETSEKTSACRTVSLIVRIAKDNRYAIDLFFHDGEFVPETVFPSPVNVLFRKASFTTGLSGRFNLSEEGKTEASNAVGVITKKIDTANYSSESVLYNDVMKIIDENGFTRDEKKAEHEVNERLYSIAESALAQNAAFADEDGSNVSFKTFLASVGIK